MIPPRTRGLFAALALPIALSCAAAWSGCASPSDAGANGTSGGGGSGGSGGALPDGGDSGGPHCGNAVIDPGEQCDDGNSTAGDGCENDCTKTKAAETVCATLAPLASGTCEVTAGDANRLLLGTVLTPGMVFRGGGVLVDATGHITCVGCGCDQQATGATKITCPTGVISPGLVNTHDHITYAQNSPYHDTGERYEHRHDWRKGQNGHTKISTPGSATNDQISWGELRFLFGGATSTVGSGAATGILRNLDKAASEEGLGKPAVDFDTFPLGDSDGTQLASGCGYPVINPASAIAADDAYLPHIAEGVNAFAENEFTCTSSSVNGAQPLVVSKTAVIHGVGLAPTDYAFMAQQSSTLIWSPRSNITLYGDTAVVTEAARLGVRVALGTDWIATGSMNLLRELKCADGLNKTYYGNFFTDEQLWMMVTANAAKAAHDDDVIGVLANGKVADVAVFDGAAHADHRAIIDGEAKDVVLVMRAGKVLYGDAAVVAATATGTCDALDMCGRAKQVCLQAEIGKSLAALTTSVGGIYGAFFCGTPDNEPTCTPTRPASVTGSTIYTGQTSATDTDGDGIPNASDDCPTVFNPIRPRDGAKQADFDGDGVGDACDPCPLDANKTTCSTFNPDDSDGDGVPNANDNCPDAANPLQTDGDNDGKGDACDPCPGIANSGATACPATIYDIKGGVVAAGTAVALENKLVTGRNAKGYFLQAKVGDPDFAGTDYSGIWVYDPSNTVHVGDRVSISSATVTNFGGQLELTTPTATVVSSLGEASPQPVAATSAELATGGSKASALEGVIVTVATATVTDVAPALGTGDTAPSNEFVVDGALRVNDYLYLVTPFPVVGEGFVSLSGILDHRNGDSKLELRSTNDVVLGQAVLTGFAPAQSFVSVGQVGVPTIPAPLTVQVSGNVATDTFVAITSGDPASLTVVGGGVTILAGTSSAPVLVNGLAQSTSVTLTATLGGSLSATVRVVGAAETPGLASLSPPTASVTAGGTVTLTVGLDMPAPAGGTAVSLAVTPANAGAVPATVTVPAGQVSATFDYVDGSTVTSATVDATLGVTTLHSTLTMTAGPSGLVINEIDYDNIGTDSAEFVEVFNPTGSPIPLAGLALVYVNGATSTVYTTVDLGPAGTIAAGQYLVVGATAVVSTIPAGQLQIDAGAVTNYLQNGAPDGVALVDTTGGKLIDALSYEGAMTAVTIASITGQVSLVEGTVLPTSVADSNTANGSLCRLPNGGDTNNAATDWKFSTTPTPGAANVP